MYNGEWEVFYPNKIKKQVGKYSSDKETGEFKFYERISGLLSHTGEYKNGIKEGNWKFYYPSGKLKVHNLYSNGSRNGIAIAYNEKGAIIEKAEYQNNVKIKDLPLK